MPVHNHMQIHELKTIEPYFSQVEKGEKTFELRFNDRDYQVGDYLLLKRYNKENNTYNGVTLLVRIKHILRVFEGLKEGWVCLSISKPLD